MLCLINMGSFIAKLFGRHLESWGSAMLTISCLFLSLLISLHLVNVISLIFYFIYIKLTPEISSEFLVINWDFMYASFIILMFILATFVSINVHSYSTEYMSHDPNLSEFMFYQKKFMFFILSLLALEFLKLLLILFVVLIIILCS